jgi:hypothetical protein
MTKPSDRATNAFLNEIWALINKFRLEWNLSYAACVGCLFQAAHDVATEAAELEAEKDAEDDND